MAKFHGVVGYGHAVETRPGVFEDQITEKKVRGDLLRNTRQLTDGASKVNFDLTVNNSVSIVADAYAVENFHAIRYIKWAGTYWTVTEVEVQRPRLLLRLGGVYNGPKYIEPPESP